MYIYMYVLFLFFTARAFLMHLDVRLAEGATL